MRVLPASGKKRIRAAAGQTSLLESGGQTRCSCRVKRQAVWPADTLPNSSTVRRRRYDYRTDTAGNQPIAMTSTTAPHSILFAPTRRARKAVSGFTGAAHPQTSHYYWSGRKAKAGSPGFDQKVEAVDAGSEHRTKPEESNFPGGMGAYRLSQSANETVQQRSFLEPAIAKAGCWRRGASDRVHLNWIKANYRRAIP